LEHWLTIDKNIFGQTYHLKTKAWGLPCARCEFLHQCMWAGYVGPKRCVEWNHAYEPMNCAEPLGLALGIISMSEDQKGGKSVYDWSRNRKVGNPGASTSRFKDDRL